MAGDARRVLLVDHDGSLRARLEDELLGAGFDVTTVASAGECLSRLERDDVAGIVSGYALPDLDGIRLLRSIRISYPVLPFVLVPEEGEGSEALAGEAVSAGVSGYVPQDSDPSTVVSRLQDSLQRGGSPTENGGEGHRRYRHLIETSPVPINVFDESGESIWCNDAVLDLLGFESREELVGRSIFEVIHPDDHDLARREMADVIGRKAPTGPTRMRLNPPDRGVRYIRVSTAIGSFLGADIGQAVAVDVTERVERERQLELLEQWLRHNIRNEMSVILGLADAIRTGSADDVAESARRIREHAAHLVEQADHERTILDVLLPGTGTRIVPTDLGDVVERAVEECREAFPDAEIELVGPEGVRVEALPEIGTAVGELVENAVRHNDTEVPEVRVEVAADDGMGSVRIADNGPGIPEGERDCLLLDREIDELHHGSGLGLVLVYWVVRLSDGEITFAENEPRGSVVTIALPRSADG